MMKATVYEMGKDGGLVKVDVPANSAKNNLPLGNVLRWGGNMAWGPEDYAVVRKGESGWDGGVYYDLVALDGFGEHRVEAMHIKAKTDPEVWHSQHFFMTDRVLTGDEVLDLVEKAKAKKRTDEEVKMASAEAHRKEVARLKAAHPNLLQLSEANQDRLTTAAKNLRKELKAKWPATKFRVTTKRYSGGNSMDVSWVDGPAYKEVDDLADKYQAKDFDGMTDSTNYRDNAWIDAFGSAGYVFAQREVSPNFVHEAAALILTRHSFTFAGDADPVTPDGINLTLSFNETHGGMNWNLGDVGRRLTAGADLTKGIAGLDEGGAYGDGFFDYRLVGRK